jgi:hypothetical protein
MKHAVIVAHPSQSSFNLSVAYAYCEAARQRGHAPILRDLYRMGFDPCLRDSEIPRPSGFKAGDDVLAERVIIAEAAVFAFIYPLWFNALLSRHIILTVLGPQRVHFMSPHHRLEGVSRRDRKDVTTRFEIGASP